ncbi:hypothetical protein Lal_00009974 [Lupinus albus]|nr:hypothetical protein Lal_00009974 [Lupinus albus]
MEGEIREAASGWHREGHVAVVMEYQRLGIKPSSAVSLDSDSPLPHVLNWLPRQIRKLNLKLRKKK